MKVFFKYIGTQAITAFDKIDSVCREINQKTQEMVWLVYRNGEIVTEIPCAEYVVERVLEKNRNKPPVFDRNQDGTIEKIAAETLNEMAERIEKLEAERRENIRLRLIVEEQKKIIAAYQRMEMER